MSDELDLAELRILKERQRIIESKSLDDETHLEKNYQSHANTFYNNIQTICKSVGVICTNEYLRDDRYFTILDQNKEQQNFDLYRDFEGGKFKDKLESLIEFNERTNAQILLHYSPTKGISFEYSSDLLRPNFQLGKDDYFGKNIEKMITGMNSSLNGVGFDTHVERFTKFPNGLKHFYAITKDFVPKEKQEDIICAISFLDNLSRSLYSFGSKILLSGEDFFKEKEESLFNITLRISE